jgi:SAM-dependent methyltransferase
VASDRPVEHPAASARPDPTRRPLEATQAFFAARAGTWDDRFADDAPAFARVIEELGVAPGTRVLDVGCGTGRALPVWRTAVGRGGVVIGVDVTIDMLAVAHTKHRGAATGLVLADAATLSVAPGCVDTVFAAGLLSHVPDPSATLVELRRVTRPGGRLGLFHPLGRRALAARHGRTLDPDELLDPRVLPTVLAGAGWDLDRIDDGPERYSAVAVATAR